MSETTMPVSDFIAECLERAGGAAERRSAQVMDVLWPAGLERVAPPGALLALALDADALAHEPGAEPATIGSPLVDALIALSGARGTTAVGHVAVARLKQKGLREEVERTLLFSHGRVRYDTGSPEFLTCTTVQFNFKVTYFSDERRERLAVLPVNLWSNQVNLPLAERLPTLVVEDAPEQHYADAPRGTVADAYETARRALRRLVDEESVHYQARLQKRFAVEFARISDYYADVARELQRRGERETDEGKARTLAQKLAAAQAERERKLHELGETYRLRSRAQLTSARLLAQPKTFFKLFIDRGQTTRTLTLAYDSVLERLEPPVCESCHQETTRIHVSPTAQLLCPACAAGR